MPCAIIEDKIKIDIRFYHSMPEDFIKDSIDQCVQDRAIRVLEVVQPEKYKRDEPILKKHQQSIKNPDMDTSI